MIDAISKEKLNIILLVDTSQSMAGKRIKQVNQAILDIKKYLINLQEENTNVDFYLTLIPFETNSHFYNNQVSTNVKKFEFSNFKCKGYSNLHLAYEKLIKILAKQSKGGIMPDFGGAAPIILLLTDGYPTGNKFKKSSETLKLIPWYKAALRYGIAIELNDKRTGEVLQDFVGDNGEVISCYDSSMLKDIIKIIVLTASIVKSSSADVASGPHVSQNELIKQNITEALTDAENWEW